MPETSKKITDQLIISSAESAKLGERVKNIPALREAIKEASQQNVSVFAQALLGGGINLNISDLHIEPSEKQALIRARIDGLLQEIAPVDFKSYQNLVSRIKLLSGIKLNITDRPQDGRFSVLIGKTSVEIRVSALPAEHGESIVLRILNPKSLITIEELGIREDLLDIFNQGIERPNGMIIITGPTGSGKTTTLYSFLKKLSKPEIKIITIEDPIEYHLKGISQTQVNPSRGYDFASGLKSLMRQDPDVILVGEVRDSETVKTAIQAALTGHLVFTTLHTNDAAGTVARLINLGAKAPDIGPAVNLIIAQRLVRKVCGKCTELKNISPEQLSEFKLLLKGLPRKIKVPEISLKTKIPAAKGCQECGFTGYQGRLGIFEVILFDEEMEKFIVKNPSIASLKEEAIKRGMVPLYQDGLLKVLNKLTTIEEIDRVAKD